jgi:hypothetical protein
VIPIDHDHVGSLVFSANTVFCRECGAGWIRYEDRGWVCVVEGEETA